MIKYKLKIIDIIDEAKGTKTYLFEKPEDFTWDAGAHTHIGMVGFDAGEKPNKSLVRHMSIMTLPNEGKVGITTRVPGSSSEFKNKLSQLYIGDEVVLFKVGSRMGARRENRPIILLSMGVGIATMRPIILAIVGDRTNIPYLVNVNVDSSGEFIFKNELDELADDYYKNHWLDSRSKLYETIEQLAKAEDAFYYVVGSYIFVKDMISHLRTNNVKDTDIIIDIKDERKNEFFEK